MVQRVLDIFFASLAILVLLPILLPLVVVLKVTGEGEIFFKQPRIGKSGREFKLIKFATMLKDSPHIGTGTVTLNDDPRILPVGRFLRKSKINELPQLLNVIRGEMSIIGPRPQTKRCFDTFPQLCQSEIIKVAPGLSGIGSIIFRNEEAMLNDSDYATDFYDSVIMPYKGALEVWYVRNNNIVVYFLLVLFTIWVVFTSKSAIAWKLFPDLPEIPNNLRRELLNRD